MTGRDTIIRACIQYQLSSDLEVVFVWFELCEFQPFADDPVTINNIFLTIVAARLNENLNGKKSIP